jgi:uncharacterized protein YecE (DUF72 family)
MIRTGIAGWSIASRYADLFPGEGTHLARYARQLAIAEINSSFYRPHRQETYRRWAESVPASFRFAVKLPRTITHERRLVECGDLVRRFADEIAGLGEKCGPLLVQFPPSFAFPGAAAEDFFGMLAATIRSPIVCEPRHPSWFASEVDGLLDRLKVARVAADPAPVPQAAEPGGWHGLAYFRLHGSPRIYWSPYSPDAIARHAEALAALDRQGVETWTIFDNTASGAAIADALTLREALLRH